MSRQIFLGSTPAHLICNKCGERSSVTLNRKSMVDSFVLTKEAAEKCYCGGELKLINSAVGALLAAKFPKKGA